MTNSLEQEFFRAEGHTMGGAACDLVVALNHAPDGDRITAEERAALWYIAYWSMDGVSRPSVMALAMHIDRGTRDTRRILSSLIDKGILITRMEPADFWQKDVHEYGFVGLGG